MSFDKLSTDLAPELVEFDRLLTCGGVDTDDCGLRVAEDYQMVGHLGGVLEALAQELVESFDGFVDTTEFGVKRVATTDAAPHFAA